MNEALADRGVARSPSLGATAFYAAGSLGTGIFTTVPAILLLFYCTETLAIPAAWAAVVVGIPKLWSVFWDPFVGAWSDRSQHPFGRRRPFLIAGTIGVVLSFIAVFSTPALPPTQAFIWVSLAYFALATLYSLFAVPYIALPAELGDTPAARARLVAARMTIMMIGLLAGASLAPVLIDAAGGGRIGYARMSLVLAALCGLTMLGPILMLKGRDRPAASVSAAPSLIAQFRRAFAHGRFRLLAAGYFLQLTATGALSAITPYLVTRALGRSESDIGAAMGALLVVAIAATPGWAIIGRRCGEYRMLALGAALFGLGCAALGAGALVPLGWPAILAGFALIGAPLAAVQVLPFILVAHLIHKQSQADPSGSVEGLFTGVWTAAEKLGLAAGPALAGIALSIAGDDIAGAAAMFLAAAPLALALISLIPLGLAARQEAHP